jgi:FkbM family methyltransferase
MIPDYVKGERADLEMISRQQCRSARLSDRALLCRVLGKYIFHADPDDVGITPHLCLDGYWESWTTIAIARLLEPGWHCVDVGANHGYFTLIMADAVEAGGRVMAIEPIPQLADLINLSLEVNGYQRRAAVLQRAASDADSKRVPLVVPRNRAMDSSLCREAAQTDDVIEVETITLDSATENWPRVDLVKIDAEGSEQAIWRGMRSVIERNDKITIIMETRCSRYADPRAFVRQIREAGFPLRYIDYDGSVRDVTEHEVLNERAEEDWMLFLRRY